MAIVGDIVPPQRRASGMGVIMTAFAAAAALGVPFGLFLAQKFRWEMPFFLVAGMGVIVWLLIYVTLPPIRAHLNDTPVHHFTAFFELLRDANAGRALLFMSALVMGHFAVIPLLAPYLVSNLRLPEDKLFLVYLVGGICSACTAPFFGRLADRLGRLRVFALLIGVACIVTLADRKLRRPAGLGSAGAGGIVFHVCQRAVCSRAGHPVAGGAVETARFIHEPDQLHPGFDLGHHLEPGRLDSHQSRRTDGWCNFDRLGWLAVGMSVVSLWLASRVHVREVPPSASTGMSPLAKIAIDAIASK